MKRTDLMVDHEAYRQWRNTCPAELLSPLSQISKWLGATPGPEPAEPARPAAEPARPEPAASILPESIPPEPARPATVAVNLTYSQQDRIDCQDIARGLWGEHPDWIQADLLKHPKIKSYVEKYKGKNTVPSWLSKVDPRLKEQRRGRPKKTR